MQCRVSSVALLLGKSLSSHQSSQHTSYNLPASPAQDKLSNEMIVFAEFSVLSTCALHQYHLVTINMDWTAAQSYCRENFVDLATVDSMEDMQGLIKEQRNAKPAWIGLTRNRSVRSWKWYLSGNQFYREGEMEYRNWAQTSEPITGQPCAALVSNETGVWRDYACTNTYSFVCSNSGELVFYVPNNTSFSY